jgi:hypothetical protein
MGWCNLAVRRGVAHKDERLQTRYSRRSRNARLITKFTALPVKWCLEEG